MDCLKGVGKINFKKVGPIGGLIAIVIVAVILLNQKQEQQPKDEIVTDGTPVYETINTSDVVDYKMSRWVIENATAKQEDVSLSQEQVNQLIEWFNSNVGASATPIDQVDPQISAGIALELKSDREIRIQYAKNEVYVTRNDLSEDGKLNYYKIENKNIAGFFDKIVKEKS